MTRITEPYLLVLPLPWYVDEAGAIWLDDLWHRDFVRHLGYLGDLTVAAPRQPKGDTPDLTRFEMPAEGTVRFVDVPMGASAVAALANMPRAAAVLWREVRRSRIVHSTVAGWPYPPGLFANPMALALKRKLIIVIESSFWRLSDPRSATWKQRLRAVLNERYARWSCNKADLAIFTSEAYRRTLQDRTKGAALIAPASWIDADTVLSAEAAAEIWRDKPVPPAFLFPARLIPEKGVEVILAALEALDSSGQPMRVDIIGDGPLRDICAETARRLKTVTLRLLDPVPYGAEFFALLHGYHAVLAPSLSDEQPRIIFDAHAQAVPLVASETGGFTGHVRAGATGFPVPRGDPRALAEMLVRLRDAPQTCRIRGLAALEEVRGQTHEAMHAEPAGMIARMLE